MRLMKNRKMVSAVGGLLLAPLLFSSGGLARDRGMVIDDFEQGLAADWVEKSFQGHTSYQVVTDPSGGHCLRAESRNAASGLIFRKEFSLKDYPILTWRWKVVNLVEKSDPRTREGDDYPARVYVIFPHWFPPKTRSINYIWATRFPKGKHIPNSFFSNAVMVAVRSGEENLGNWVEERRNVLQDYREIFGDDPPKAGGIAIMTDTDNTGESAVACYDDLRLEKE